MRAAGTTVYLWILLFLILLVMLAVLIYYMKAVVF